MLCATCGIPTGNHTIDESLWDIYYRLDDSRSYHSALTFSSDWLSENVEDEDDRDAINLAMERDMGDRGLCVSCGRPDLRGVTPEMILSEEDAREMAAMAAEYAAEMRAGC